MTQEIKGRLEQAAKHHAISIHDRTTVTNTAAYIDFKAAGQTILDNPSEWGLVDEKLFRSLSNSCESWANKWAEKSEKCRELQSQLTKYREALEWYSNIENYLEGDRPMISKFGVNADITSIAKEALKQEVNND